MIRASAVGGIVMFWTYFTLNAFKICKEIVFPPKFECAEKKEEVLPPKCAEKEEVVCDGCQKPYLDDGEYEDCQQCFLDGLEHKKFFCKNCRDDYNCKNNFKNITMSDNKLVKTIMEAATLTGLAAGIGWASKKVLKEEVTANPSANVKNYVKFTAVMAASIALKDYLEKQKILPD